MGIKNIVFDLGGVIIDLDREKAVRHFEQIGVTDAEALIDAYEQKGIFLEVEDGRIDAEEFRRKLSVHTGKQLSLEDVTNAWLGFVVDVPQYKLDYILSLRKMYKVYLLSNTNPILQLQWAQTPRFTAAGRPLNDYFDKLYTSYEIGVTKPDRRIFEYMIADSGMIPAETLFVDDGKSNIEVGKSFGFQTYMPVNGEDWRKPIDAILEK
ncbi:HAD superfamily hydrolase (TIGR01509 family) [Parabacteroides sp. PF5-9]|nr:HAD superfamily hydrolase (TIGR01509 family) [Parabacteroides sp. PF5-9]